MKHIKHLKLGQFAKDSATGLSGMITHLNIDCEERFAYCFQPRGLKPDDGLPVESFWLEMARLTGHLESVTTPFPVEALNTAVEDKASGFRGVLIALCLHITGCVHGDVQPSGANEKSGGRFKIANFDLRRLKGKHLPDLTEKQIEQDQHRRPSPGACPSIERSAP